jgi:hypothetical protein
MTENWFHAFVEPRGVAIAGASPRGWPLLAGLRGRSRYDVEATARAISSISHPAAELEEELEDLEINPWSTTGPLNIKEFEFARDGDAARLGLRSLVA